MNCSIYYRPQEAPGGYEFQIVKDSVRNNLAGWSATTNRSVIPVCDPEQEGMFAMSFGGQCHVFSK